MRSNGGRTPLHDSCILNEIEICDILIRNGASINAQDNEGNTPTHYAALYSTFIYTIEHLTILNMILKNNPDLSIENKKKQSPIDITNDKEVISLLCKYTMRENNNNQFYEVKNNGQFSIRRNYANYAIKSSKIAKINKCALINFNHTKTLVLVLL